MPPPTLLGSGWSGSTVTFDGPDGPEVLSIGHDVTARRVAELRLAESEARFRDLAEKSADVVWHFAMDPYPHFDYVSPSVEHSLGYPVAFFLDDFTRFLDILDERGRAIVERGLRGELVPERRDFRFRHADGSIVIGETLTTKVRGGLQGVSRDVTELRELQEAMTALALRDPLTGLANRRLFFELLDAELARAERSGLPLAVAFLDLNGFKRINDTYGHDAGDAVLCETARRLMSVVRGTDVVARLGGDEFTMRTSPTLRIVDRAGGSNRRSAGAAVHDPRRRLGVVCREHRLRRHRNGHRRSGRAARGRRERRDVPGQAGGTSGRSVLTPPVRSGTQRANRRSDATAGADASERSDAESRGNGRERHERRPRRR